eukprot:CAMPEP_0205805508 /NCGR_PEP_ID=MMETSP0205-20121125/8765_1 /ASSEMBLY_ACC=CAM_ASM_000278 /TAXON_ID=36767 /ORGANISM="Euplotes focardii, Strain TN1" /LENGTH=223 /DNA_ID=CAMNT_0053076863 /DNA_START=41 /DNA_END=709 /DNA_ORIENTATION=+
MTTLFDNVLNGETKNLNQDIQVHRRRTYFMKSDKLLQSEDVLDLSEGKFNINIPEAQSSNDSFNTDEEEKDDGDRFLGKRRDIADGTLYKDLMASNLQKYVLDKVGSVGNLEMNTMEKERVKDDLEEEIKENPLEEIKEDHIEELKESPKYEIEIKPGDQNLNENEESFDIIDRRSGSLDNNLKQKLFDESAKATKDQKDPIKKIENLFKKTMQKVNPNHADR